MESNLTILDINFKCINKTTLESLLTSAFHVELLPFSVPSKHDGKLLC